MLRAAKTVFDINVFGVMRMVKEVLPHMRARGGGRIINIELKDQSHPASRVAHRIKSNLTAFFRAEAEQGGASDPDLLARQLILVFDGASARAGIGADSLAGLIAPTVATLLDAAGMR